MKIKRYEGPDISYHNGDVNIKRVRDAGCQRIGIRAGYGKNNVDQKYMTNAQACFNLIVRVLLYWFSYAYTAAMAVKEAEYAIAQAAKFWRRCPIAFDFEYDSVRYARTKGVNVTKQLATDMAIAFLKTVKAAGYIPVIYTNRDYMRNYFDMSRIVKEVGTVYVWYARYTSKLPKAEENIPDVWQYTSKGCLPGVKGNVDMNEFYTDFSLEDERVAEKVEVTCNINIQTFQHAANADGCKDQNGNVLAEDGIDGPKTQYVRKKIFLKARAYFFVGSTGELVKWWQQRLNEVMGLELEVDGKFGKATRVATVAFQKRFNLDDDGIAGYNTIQMAFYH